MSCLVLSAYTLLILILTAPALAQTNHENPLADAAHGLVVRGDSPTPGKRPATMMRTSQDLRASLYS